MKGRKRKTERRQENWLPPPPQWNCVTGLSLDRYRVLVLAFSVVLPVGNILFIPFLSSQVCAILSPSHCLPQALSFGPPLSSPTSLFNDGNFLPRSECELMWRGSRPPAVPDEAWWEITQSSLLSDCNSLFGWNKQANPCTHTHTQTPLITCINYTVWDHHGDHSCADPALLSGSLRSSSPRDGNSVVAVRCNST